MEATDIAEYFSREDTPSAISPLGAVMVKVLAKYPEFDFAKARVEAHALLNRAAQSRRYRVPAVLSVEEKRTQADRLKAAFVQAT